MKTNLSNNEIVQIIYDNGYLNALFNYYHIPKSPDRDDLFSIVMLNLLEYDNVKLNNAYKTNNLYTICHKFVRTEISLSKSQFNRAIKNNRCKSVEINSDYEYEELY